MSLAAQEQVLLDLLFDRERRELFRRDPAAALAPYGLDADECADFATIRPDALELDATVRAGLILAQFCRSYPLSFSLLSSLPGGLDLLRGAVDAALMRTAPPERAAALGIRLRDAVRDMAGPASARERARISGIVEAELGMAWTAQQARAAALAGEAPATVASDLPEDWLRRPLRLAPFTSAAILPRPYAVLKDALCPCTGAELWRRLAREPMSPSRRQELLAQDDLRLLVGRAEISRPSPCEPVVEHVTVELGEGFARLLPHLDGRASVSDLLAKLRDAGADDALLAGVTSGFRRLGEQGMLAPA